MTITTSRHEGEDNADLTIRWPNNTSLIIGASYDKKSRSSVAYGADGAQCSHLGSLFTKLLKTKSTIEALDALAKEVGGMVLSRKAKAKATRCDVAPDDGPVVFSDRFEPSAELLAALQ